ncbi:hypothetical protein SAMN05216464_1041 [Mucilaginibacter pineti]|uniref:Polyvalent protein metallopeptidase domain-containing protein n=1 Tax=Mucilaginibacter pineti TaxID=1391627 RepID=A0A1G7A8P3_9SPHI|nr:hypothetical protein SAMN05216464_1041 [Mucilaginibacter pineti]
MNHFGTPDYAREELRAEIASMLIGQEFKIGHDPGQHAAYVDNWVQILTDTPFEIHSAAADAEKIFSYLMDIERKRDLKTEAAVQVEAQGKTVADAKHLSIGDEIAYNDSVYKVLSHIKQGRLRIEDTGTGNQFTLSRKDGLYSSLLAAKNGTAPQAHQEQIVGEEPEQNYSATYGIRR